jgi:hypothetical protein
MIPREIRCFARSVPLLKVIDSVTRVINQAAEAFYIGVSLDWPIAMLPVVVERFVRRSIITPV